MNRTTIINYLIAKSKAKSYLEIGVWNGHNFNNIVCAKRIGADPSPEKLKNPELCKVMTSDEFFAQNTETFDAIFIDGLHHADQVLKDLKNATKCLNPNGFIVCHDMNPITKRAQEIPYSGQGMWNGDCWKALVQFRQEQGFAYDVNVINVDHGCGVITPKKHIEAIELFDVKELLTYENLEKNRAKWLNLIEFHDWAKNVTFDEMMNAYVGDTTNEYNNYVLALWYDNMGQTASAISYYIRSAERSDIPYYQYECLIRAALCFQKQGTRGLSVRGLLQRALSILPNRPEAYFLLARYHERESTVESWVNCYTYASMALGVCDFNCGNLRTWVEYPGYYGMLFEKSVSGWWVGLCEEAKNNFIELYKNHPLDEMHRGSVINNLKFMKVDISKL
jgi:tetratricopeptide (TPR) repeat protein